jgi:hypothetical protein
MALAHGFQTGPDIKGHAAILLNVFRYP